MSATAYLNRRKRETRNAELHAPITPRAPRPGTDPDDARHPLCDTCAARVVVSFRARLETASGHLRHLDQVCCGCNRGTRSGLILIADPASVPCQGRAPEPSGNYTW